MRRRLLEIAVMWLACSGCTGSNGDLPKAYRTIPVPEERLRSTVARMNGRSLFLTHCALCHGDRADGRGVRREGLAQPPQDFTDDAWRRGTSPRRVFYVIREGVHGTAMPSWKALPDDAIWDLVAYVLSVGAA